MLQLMKIGADNKDILDQPAVLSHYHGITGVYHEPPSCDYLAVDLLGDVNRNDITLRLAPVSEDHLKQWRKIRRSLD